MKLSKVLLAVVVCATLGFVSCKPKDADIKAEIDKSIQSNADMSGLSADVKDGVVTLTGTCKDNECKAKCASAVEGVKGVKSVVNNISVPPPPPPPAAVEITADDPLAKAVADAVKDHPTVRADVKDGVITLTGEIKKDELKKLMPLLQSLKPKKVENKATIK
jgi:hyperosmotically inducible periplasmic protein